ncbi:MAG: exodeoxyribonuclease VII small subunit [Planctomycetaceae bacterium]|nr:exodeoxyribonuclease VII small subunit [Planctomycetaceae bacterium]
MTKISADKKEKKDLTFEESFERLQSVVNTLESGQASLDNSLKLYEEGISLIRKCHEHLAGARRKIELITGINANGEPITEPLKEEERSLEERSETKGR